MAAPEELHKPILVLVEGRDDLYLTVEMLAHLEREDVQIIEYDGKDNLGITLRTLRATPGFGVVSTVGVTRDADDDADGALAHVNSCLDNAGFSQVVAVCTKSDGAPATCAFLFPGNGESGELETLCLKAVSNKPVMQCVDAYMDCVEEMTTPADQPAKKAKIHAYLAGVKHPGKPIGLAAGAGYIPLDSDAFEAFRAFLGML